jgi:predicted CoA-binding protein
VAVTPPEATEAVAHACVDLGVPRLWMHQGMGAGSVSEAAADVCRAHGIAVIPGACPMMYLEPVDFAHRCFGGWGRLTGRLPAVS